MERKWVGKSGLNKSVDSLLDSVNDKMHEIEIIIDIKYQPAKERG